MTDAPLLQVDNLRVRFPSAAGVVEAVRGVSFTLGHERLGIVGESGSGKSMTGRAILDLIPPPGIVLADRMAFHGEDLLGMDQGRRRRLRGSRISMVMQDPRHSLNPVQTIGRQIGEAVRVHARVSRREARERTLAMLESVRIREPGRVHELYPHQVSGGMGQRVMIAMMLIADPDVLIADEPTSALDVTVQIQILEILDEMVTSRGMGLVFISHDLRLVRSFCDRVVVMYAGRVVQTLAAAALDRPAAAGLHPYTSGLLACQPELGRHKARLCTLARDPAWAE